MKAPVITVRDVYKLVSETERRSRLAKSILKIIKIEQEKKVLPSSDEVVTTHSTGYNPYTVI